RPLHPPPFPYTTLFRSFSVDFRDPLHGILGAGELAAPTAFADTVARSSNGGKTWQLASRPPVPGAIYGLSYVRERSAEGDADERSEEHTSELQSRGHLV